MLNCFTFLLAASAALAGRGAEIAIPVPAESMFPPFETIALSPDIVGGCAELMIGGFNSRFASIETRMGDTGRQHMALSVRAIDWSTVATAKKSTRVGTVRSNRQAGELSRELGADLVAWWLPGESPNRFRVVDPGNDSTLAEVVVSPSSGRSIEQACERWGENFATKLWENHLPSLQRVQYTLAKTTHVKEMENLLVAGEFERLGALLDELEREDPFGVAVQFNLGVLHEVRGDLDRAEAYYSRAEGVDTDLIEEARERVALRRRQLSRFEARGYSVSQALDGGALEVVLGEGLSVENNAMLFVDSDPIGATVFIGADELGVTPVKIRGLAPGSALITLVLEDHGPGTATVELVSRQWKVADIPLLREQGSVRIHARPSSSVEVGGNTLEVDASGVVEFGGLGVGEQQVTVSLKGHTPVQESVVIKAGRTVDLSVEQGLAPASLVVVGSPVEAVVSLDGRVLNPPDDSMGGFGESLVIREPIEPGSYQLEVTAPDHEPMRQMLELEPGGEHRIEFSLEPTTGGVVLNIAPSGAQVLVAGERYDAEGRLALEGLAAGVYPVEISHSDYRPWSEDVRVTGEAGQVLDVALEPLPGRVLVVSQPLGAAVWIAGERVGVTPYSGSVPAGEVSFVLELEGFVDGEREMDILPNRDHRVNVVLEEE
jgi:hypothetical protein